MSRRIWTVVPKGVAEWKKAKATGIVVCPACCAIAGSVGDKIVAHPRRDTIGAVRKVICFGR